MNKPESLRTHLLAAVPELRHSPDQLLVFIDKGKLRCTAAASLSWEYGYELQIILTDFAGHLDAAILQLLAGQGEPVRAPGQPGQVRAGHRLRGRHPGQLQGGSVDHLAPYRARGRETPAGRHLPAEPRARVPVYRVPGAGHLTGLRRRRAAGRIAIRIRRRRPGPGNATSGQQPWLT